MRRAIGSVVAVVAAAAAFGGAASPAMAQVCFDGTGTTLDGTCVNDTQPECIRGICVEGLWENVAAAEELAWSVVGTAGGVAWGAVATAGAAVNDVVGMVPDRVCTPSLLAGPICVTP